MKATDDPRHKHRVKLMQDIYAWQLNKQHIPIYGETRQIIDDLPKIDTLIESAASNRPLSEVNKIDLAILRLAIFELISNLGEGKESAQRIPYKVVVDEAVELGKEFGSESSYSFINGVLGKVIENLSLDK